MRSKQISIDKHYAFPGRNTPIRKISGSTASDSISFDELHDIKIDLPNQNMNLQALNQTPELPQLIHKGSGDYQSQLSKMNNQNMFASPQIRGITGPIKKRSDDFTLDGDSNQTPGEKEQSLRIRMIKNIVQEKQSKSYQMHNNFSDQSTKKGSEYSENNSPHMAIQKHESSITTRKPIYRIVSQGSNGKFVRQIIGYADSVIQQNSPAQFSKASNDSTFRNFNQISGSKIRSTSNSIQPMSQKRPSVRGRIQSVTTSSLSASVNKEISNIVCDENITRQKSLSRHSILNSSIFKIQKQQENQKQQYMSRENQEYNPQLISNTVHAKQQFFLKQCLDQYDHNRFETLGNDEKLDQSFLEEFLQLNHAFVEQNAIVTINSIERMYTNNCKATLECLMKCTIPQKSSALLAPHTIKLSEKYHKIINQLPKTHKNKYINSTFSSKQIQPENYIRSPFDIVLIVDFNEQYHHSLFSTVREMILNQTTSRDRVCLIFPSKQGKCVRTDLLLCTQENQQLLINAFEQTVSDVSKCQEFHEISLKNAVWTIKESQYQNFQSAIFWISEGQTTRMLELAQDLFFPSSIKSFEETENISQNDLKDDLERNQQKSKSYWKNMQVYTFQYGNRNTDLSLQKIADIKKGNYYFINQIEELKKKICEAINDLTSNIGFQFSASVDLITHQKINVKKQLETQSTLSSIPQLIAMESSVSQQKSSQYFESFINTKHPTQVPTQSEINKLQQQNYKLFESEISKVYWGQKILDQNNDKNSISFSLPQIKSNSVTKFGCQITIKPSHFLSSCDIVEFEIANAICMINTIPSHLRANIIDFSIKKFASCTTELHFLLNRNSFQSINEVKRQTFNDFSNAVSCDLSNLPKNKEQKQEILQTIFNQEVLYLFYDIYSNIKVDEEKILNYAGLQLKNAIEKQLCYFKQNIQKQSENSIEKDIEEFQQFINIFGFDQRAKCYFYSILNKYQHQR